MGGGLEYSGWLEKSGRQINRGAGIIGRFVVGILKEIC